MGSNQKIYITNLWHTKTNYGANLTAYALQNILRNLGRESLLTDNISLLAALLTRKGKFSASFVKQNLKTTRHFEGGLDFLNSETDTFITGSDQVFRKIYMQGKPEQYLLDFAAKDKKKIAFSASFGIDKGEFLKETPAEVIEHMKTSLKSFDFISVREKSGVKICKDVLGVDAEWIIDPVFILDRTYYDGLIKNSAKDYKNKIVAYVLDTNKEYKKAYKFLSEKYNKPVIETADSNISVEDWLASIRDCDLFVTDSFHGMCFAMIFNKPFICISNKERGGTRFDSICEMLGVENKCIDSIAEVLERDCIFKIDYSISNKRILEERQKGLDFLKKALDTPAKVTQ